MCDYTRGFLMSTKKGQSSSTVKDVEALAARICSVYEIIAGQKLKYWEKHLKDLHWFQRLDGVSPESIDAEAKKYMQNLKTLKTALGENWPRFFCPDAKSLQNFGIEHNMDVSLVGNDGEKREITNVLLDEEADITKLATAIKEEINEQRVVARTLSNADALDSRSPSVQPLPRGSSSVQPSPQESPSVQPSPQESPSPQPLPRGSSSPQPLSPRSPIPQPLSPRSPSPQPSSPREPSVPRSPSNSVHLQTPGGNVYPDFGPQSPTKFSPWDFGTPGRQDNDNPESNYVYVHNVDQNNLVYIYMIPESLNSSSDVNNLNQDITGHLSTDINLTTLKDCVEAIHDNKKIGIGLCVVKREEEKLTMGVVSMEENAVQTFVKFKSASDSDPDIPYWFEKNPEILTLDINDTKKAQAYHTNAETMDDGEPLQDVNPELDYSNENHAPVFVIGNDVFWKKTQELAPHMYLQIVQTASNQSAQSIAETLRGLVQGETHDSLPQREAVVAVVKMAFNGPIDKGEAKCMVSFIDETPQGDIQALPVPRQGAATDSDDNNRASHILEHFNKQIVDDIVLWNSKKETETKQIRNFENAGATCYLDVCIQLFTTNEDIIKVLKYFDFKNNNNKFVRDLTTSLLEVYTEQEIDSKQPTAKKLAKEFPIDVLCKTYAWLREDDKEREIESNADLLDEAKQHDVGEFLLQMIQVLTLYPSSQLKELIPKLTQLKELIPKLKYEINRTKTSTHHTKKFEPKQDSTQLVTLLLSSKNDQQKLQLHSLVASTMSRFDHYEAGEDKEFPEKHTMIETFTILNSPEYLFFYVNRNTFRGKNITNIEMDFDNITPFSECQCKSFTIQQEKYELIYVMTHDGPHTDGHYISHYRRPRKYAHTKNNHDWYRLNDCDKEKQAVLINTDSTNERMQKDIKQGNLFVLKKVHNEHRDKYRMFETYSTNINSEEADQIWMSDFASVDLSSMTVDGCQNFLLTKEKQSPHIFKNVDGSLHSWVVESFIPEVLKAVKKYRQKSLKEVILHEFPHPNTGGDVGSIVLKYKANISNEKETKKKDEQWDKLNILYNVHSFIGTKELNLETFHRYNKFNARFAFNWMRPKIMMEHPEHKEAMNLIQECLLQHDITKCQKQIDQLKKYSWVLAAYKHKFLQKYDKDFANSSSKNININLSMMTNSDYFVPAILDVMGIPCTDSEMSLDAVREAYTHGLFHNEFKLDITYDEWKENARTSLLNSLQQKFNNQDFTPDLNKVLEDSKTHWNEWFKQIFKLYAPKDSIENYNKYSTENTIILSETGVRYFDAKFQEFLMEILDQESHFQTIITAAKVQWLKEHLPP